MFGREMQLKAVEPTLTAELSSGTCSAAIQENTSLNIEHATQLYMDSLEQLDIVEAKLVGIDPRTNLAVYQRLSHFRSTLAFKANRYYERIRELFHQNDANASALRAIAYNKPKLHGGQDNLSSETSTNDNDNDNNYNGASTSSTPPPPIEVLGYTTATYKDYGEKLATPQPLAVIPVEQITIDEITKPVVSKIVETVESATKPRTHKVYSADEIQHNIELLNQKKLSPQETEFFLLDIIHQSKDTSNKAERDNILTSAVCAIEKELYDTEYDVRHLVADAILSIYDDDKEALKSIRETKFIRRISNWARYELKSRNDDKLAKFLQFIKGLQFSEAQLNTVKLTDLLKSVSKRNLPYTSIAAEILDIAAEITRKEKVARKAKIDEHNAKKAEEQKRLEQEREKGTKEHEKRNATANITPTLSNRIATPAKSFSFSSYLNGSRPPPRPHSPLGKADDQEKIDIREPQHRDISADGLKSILKSNSEKSAKKKVVMFPAAADKMVSIRYIEPREIDSTKDHVNAARAKEMTLSEASLLKKQRKSVKEAEVFEEEEGDIFWVTPMRIDFQKTGMNLSEVAQSRGGYISLATNEESNKFYGASNKSSSSPYEPSEGLITQGVKFDLMNYKIEISKENSTNHEDASNSVVLNPANPTFESGGNSDSNKNPDQDVLDLLDDNLLPGNGLNKRKRSVDSENLSEIKKSKTNQTIPPQSLNNSSPKLQTNTQSPPLHQQEFPQPNKTNYLPQSRQGSYQVNPKTDTFIPAGPPLTDEFIPAGSPLTDTYIPTGPSSSRELLPNRTQYLNGHSHGQGSNNYHYDTNGIKIKNSGNLPIQQRPIGSVSNQIMNMRASDIRPAVRVATRNVVKKWTIPCSYYGKKPGCKRGDGCMYLHMEPHH